MEPVPPWKKKWKRKGSDLDEIEGLDSWKKKSIYKKIITTW